MWAGDAGKVLACVPGEGAGLTVATGVNQAACDPRRHDVISAASCAANCVAPMAKVLGWYDNEWGYGCRLAGLTTHVGSRL